MQVRRIGVVGYGEVGKIFAAGLQRNVEQVSAWDLKFAQAAAGAGEQGHARERGIRACHSMQDLCEASDLLISAVTASNTLAVAQEAARFLRPGTVFLDLNSASPGTKQQAGGAVQRHQDVPQRDDQGPGSAGDRGVCGSPAGDPHPSTPHGASIPFALRISAACAPRNAASNCRAAAPLPELAATAPAYTV